MWASPRAVLRPHGSRMPSEGGLHVSICPHWPGSAKWVREQRRLIPMAIFHLTAKWHTRKKNKKLRALRAYAYRAGARVFDPLNNRKHAAIPG